MSNAVNLVVSDVDGTLITPDHVVTPRAIRAVLHLKDQGIGFTLASSRPPRGLQGILETLGISLPYAPFNGAQIVSPDGTIIAKQLIPVPVIRKVQALATSFRLNLWVYRELEWYVERRDEYVEREEQTSGFRAEISDPIERFFENCPKLTIVGPPNGVEACQHRVLELMGSELEATRSKPRFLDITVKSANKGAVITNLSRILHIPVDQIAAIGDGPNDVEMFRRTGLSIAMGNGNEEVRKSARFVTNSNSEEGFANGIERYILKEREGAAA